LNQNIQDALAKANESLGAAKVLAREGYPNFAVSRAYYAMFYAVEALLLYKGLAFSSHSAVIAAFGKEYAKSGLLPPQLHRYLIDAERLRNVGDYGLGTSVPIDDVAQVFARTEEFLQIVIQFLSDATGNINV